MKKTLYILPATLLMLSGCYDSHYALENRMVGDIKTLPASIDDSNKTISLSGDGGETRSSLLYFQLSRSRDFTNGETLSISYNERQGISCGRFGGSYYYRLYAALDEDRVYAPNIETFDVDNTVSIYSIVPSDATTYQLICTSNLTGTTLFRVSTDQDFKEYEDYNATNSWHNDSWTEFHYSVTLENLDRGTTYYVKAVREVILGSVESDVESFTTTNILKMGEVTYTGWDGKTYPMTEGYDHFLANYAYNGQVLERNIEIYRSENGWTLSKDITPEGTGRLYGFYSYDRQNSDDEIQIQTYKYDNPTLMWGVAEENNGVFNIHLRNMLSRVVFHLTVSNDYPEDKPEAREFTIKGNTLPSIANFQVNDGGFVYNQSSFSEPLGYWNTIGLIKGETVDLVLYSIPTNGHGNATLSMNFMDNKFDSVIDIDWASGNTYEYNVTVTAEGLSISDVIVNQWQPTEGGSIIINPNK